MGVFVNRAHLCMQGTDSGESGRVWASITRQRPRGSGVGSTAKGKGRGAVVWAHTSETPSLLQSAVRSRSSAERTPKGAAHQIEGKRLLQVGCMHRGFFNDWALARIG